MKTLTRNCIGVLGGAAAICGLISAAAAQDAELVGSWNCSGGMEDQEVGMSMTVAIEQTYANDGSYERSGDFRMAMPALQIDISFMIEESGSWRRDGTEIAETPAAIEVKSDSAMPSPIEQLLLQQMTAEAEQAVNSETTARIQSLTETSLVMRDESGVETTCARA